MKKVLLLVIAAITSASCFAQYEAKMKDQNVIKGSVIVNGEKIDGYIKKVAEVDVNGDSYPAFFLLQSEFTFIDKVTFETVEKLKGKHKITYSPKDCDGFEYGDFVFETRKFCIDPTAMGTNAIPKKIFLHVQKKYDKVTFYNFYDNVGNWVDGQLNRDKVSKDIASPGLVYYIEGADRAKWIYLLNAKKELPNCSAILEKVENKMYKYDRTAEDNYKLYGRSETSKSEMLTLGDDNRNLNILDDYINGKCE